MKKELIFTLFILILFCSGCTKSSESKLKPTGDTPVKELATQKCIDECKNRLALEIDLSDGPCLSDGDVNWMIEDWVCDVAHSPRVDVDNQPENQCQTYREGKAHHFVEVDPDCNFIRAV